MAVFFELTTDVFQERFDSAVKQRGRKSAGAVSVRRPLRGLEVKEDTFAMIKVVDMLGRDIKLYDGGSFSGKTAQYTNFILQSVQETRAEKFQLAETFGDPYIFLFGENPRFLDCAAVLINSADFNWQNEFWENYDTYLRGTKCAENGTRIYLFYDDIIVEGYMLNATAQRESMNPMMVPLQFKLFLTNYRNVSMVGDPNFPIRLGVDVDAVTKSEQSIDANGNVTVRHLRGLTFENADEWTGARPPVEYDDTPVELDDLIQFAVAKAAENAANMNHVDTLADAGLINANSGGGTGSRGGPRTSTDVENDAILGDCVSSPYFENGISYCQGPNGVITLGPDPNPPAKTPPGWGNKEYYPGSTKSEQAPTQTINVPAPASDTGAFSSTAVPNSSSSTCPADTSCAS